MITVSTKNLLGPDEFADVLVNPVNCLGVPGAGLARQFSEAWPIDTAAYARFARRGNMRPGDVYLTREQDQWIAHLATKAHYRDPSQERWIELGLNNLVVHAKDLQRESGCQVVALPMLGCGLGGLKPQPVINLMLEILGQEPGFTWRVHARDHSHSQLLRERLSSVQLWFLDELKLTDPPKTPPSSD